MIQSAPLVNFPNRKSHHSLALKLAPGEWLLGWSTSNVGCFFSHESNVDSVGATGPVSSFPVFLSNTTILSSDFDRTGFAPD